MIKTAAEIAMERPGDDDRAYMHSIMCQVGLPRSRLKGTRLSECQAQPHYSLKQAMGW
ncbi:hypothetical protein [Xylella fastidiosa]|uniref:hypothetical protein n=1 Tax=Xylella fastidiosa TaxID=2371 RepID=UPI0034DFCB4B